MKSEDSTTMKKCPCVQIEALILRCQMDAQRFFQETFCLSCAFLCVSHCHPGKLEHLVETLVIALLHFMVDSLRVFAFIVVAYQPRSFHLEIPSFFMNFDTQGSHLCSFNVSALFDMVCFQ